MRVPHEVEVKLEFEAAARPKILDKLGPATATKHMVSVYFDTRKRHLFKQGVSLRVRTVGGLHVQTIKTAARSAGLSDRAEWECPLQDDQPDLEAVADTPVYPVLNDARGALVPLFETAVDRTTWMIETKRSRIEVALDEGTIVAGSASAPLAELEFELKRGRPSDLFTLIRSLEAVVDLRTAVLAKSERGYALLKRQRPGASKAEPIHIGPGMTTAEAFQNIARNCLRQFRLNEPLVVGARLPEALHQARVAMRRLRSAFSVFKPVISDGTFETLNRRLRDATTVLGEARNLDVYLAHVGDAGTADTVPGLPDFLQAIEGRRAKAYDEVVATLGAKTFCRLMLDLLAWIEAGPWLVTADPLRRALRDQPAILFAAGVLDRRRRKLVKNGLRLDKLDPTERHQVRIAAKKLRYAAEFFAGLADTKREDERYARFIRAMADLQEHLGALNDIETARAIELDFARHREATGQATGVFAAGHARGTEEARIHALLAAAAEAHTAFADTKRFWVRWSDA